jgi:hypothetical protein
VGVGHKGVRKRAVGTREHIIAYLTEINELYDANGMASTQLAAEVGYPGSSVAFAQLLSGMERSGLIEREVRGKRTYRISLGPVHALGPFQASGTVGVSGTAGVPGSAGIGAAGFDYDELARRLLVQVVRRLAATEPEASPPERSDRAALQETVSGLEYELLRATQRSLALAAERVRRLPASSDLDSSEVVLLQRLLTSNGAGDSGGSGQEGLEEAQSVVS